MTGWDRGGNGLCHATASYRITDDWRENPNGESYLEGIRETGSPDLQRRAQELLTHLGPEISAVEERFVREHGWTPNRASRVWETDPTLQGAAPVKIPTPPRPWRQPQAAASPLPVDMAVIQQLR